MIPLHAKEVCRYIREYINRDVSGQPNNCRSTEAVINGKTELRAGQGTLRAGGTWDPNCVGSHSAMIQLSVLDNFQLHMSRRHHISLTVLSNQFRVNASSRLSAVLRRKDHDIHSAHAVYML